MPDSIARAQAAKQRGQKGEDAAARLLQGKGMEILERNWRHGQWELDIVCRDGDTLVFVEVKTRDARGMARPDDALTPRKKNALRHAIHTWLHAHDAWEYPCRVDVVAVYCADDTLTLEHYPDAFSFSPPVGGGNTTWQPW